MLSYQYHDAILEEINFDDGQCIELTFLLYPIFYPQTTRVSVRLEKVLNFESVRRFLEPICAEKLLDLTDRFLGTCEAFHADTKLQSQEGSFRLFIKIADFGSTRIHCKGFGETLLPHASTNSDA